MKPRRFALPLITAAVLNTAISNPADVAPDSPVFEMDEVTVFESQTSFSPAFSNKVPQMSYYEVPDLPRGDLIYALEFFDQYREGEIPGRIKWCGLLYFPVVDGYERNHLKWLGLYLYNDRMYGYDPTALKEYERRFAVPIQPQDRARPEVLFKFAESYVESVFPGGDEEFLTGEFMDMGDGGEGYYEESYDMIYIDPGRIAPVLKSEQGKKPEELVRLVMQFNEDPNPTAGAEAKIGRAEDAGRTPFTWDSFWDELTYTPDFLEVAAELVKPRWSQVSKLHYKKDRFILGEKEYSPRVLLFNIGQKIYAYSPKYGVWRTQALLGDLNDPERLAARLQYPGVETVVRVEFVAKTTE
jgi:hypothetical protein